MSMVFGLDLHRQQITFDGLDVESGEVWKGRVWQPDRERFRRWLEHDVAGRAKGQPVALAVEGCTGAGATWSKRSPPLASRRTWPSQPTRKQQGGRSGGQRRIVPTQRCCASCCSVACRPVTIIFKATGRLSATCRAR